MLPRVLCLTPAILAESCAHLTGVVGLLDESPEPIAGIRSAWAFLAGCRTAIRRSDRPVPSWCLPVLFPVDRCVRVCKLDNQGKAATSAPDPLNYSSENSFANSSLNISIASATTGLNF